MSLVLFSGPVRSGKSNAAEGLAASRGTAVYVAAAGWDGDEEMERRIGAHKASRPAHWTTVRAGVDPAWIADVPDDAVLLVDCLGTLVSIAVFGAVGEAEVAPRGAEALVATRIEELVNALIARRGDTIVVSNEAGWGLVPGGPGPRNLRDGLGRVNRRLTAVADRAYVVINGRFLDLRELPERPTWPDTDEGR